MQLSIFDNKLSVLVFSASLLLSACGFQLRGTAGGDVELSSVYVTSSNANGLSRIVQRQLQFYEVTIPESPTSAEHVINLANEQQERNVLTVSSSTGKVQEYELILKVDFSLADGNGNTLIDTVNLVANRELFFDENAVLAIGEEENTVYQELRQQLANTIVRRVQAASRQSN